MCVCVPASNYVRKIVDNLYHVNEDSKIRTIAVAALRAAKAQDFIREGQGAAPKEKRKIGMGTATNQIHLVCGVDFPMVWQSIRINYVNHFYG